MHNFINSIGLILCLSVLSFSEEIDKENGTGYQTVTDSVIDENSQYSSGSVIHDTALSLSADSLPVRELEKMVVTAKLEKIQLKTAQSVSVIKSTEWAGTSKGIADIIAEQTGIQTRQYGGTGSFQSVSIRGVQGSEILVLLDGIPLNSAMGGAVDLGKINPAIIDEIEVYKGITPSKFGGNSIGGVINLKRKRSTRGKTVHIASSMGAYGFQNHLLSFGQNLKKVDLYGSLSFTRSDNDFLYLDRNSTVSGTAIDPTFDDTVRRFENNQYVATELVFYPTVHLNDTYRMISGVVYSWNTIHIPAPEGKVNKTAWYEERNFTCNAKLVKDETDNRFSVIPGIGYVVKKGTSFGTSLDQATYGNLNIKRNSYLKLETAEQIISLPIQFQWNVATALKLDASVVLTYDDFNPISNLSSTVVGDWRSREVNGYGAVDMKFNPGMVGFQAGVSAKGIYEKTDGGIDMANSVTVPPSDTIISLFAASAGVNFRAGNHLLIYGNGGRYTNAPTLRERYGAKGGLIPNPDLESETGYSADIGCKLSMRSLYAELACFYTRSKNTIIILRSSYQTKPVNCEGSEAYGTELNVKWDVNKFISTEIKSTVQKTKNRALENMWYGRSLPNEPAVSVFYNATVGPFRGVTLNYRADFKSFYYRDFANTESFRVPVENGNAIADCGRLLHNFSITWKPLKNLALSCSARNITPDILSIDEAPHAVEGDYSWVLYPSNDWSVSVEYSF